MHAIDFLFSMGIPSDSIVYPHLEIKNGATTGIIESDINKIRFFKSLENIETKYQNATNEKLNSLIEKTLKTYKIYKENELKNLIFKHFDFMTVIESNNKIHFFPYYKKFRQYDKAEENFKKELKKIHQTKKRGVDDRFGIDFFRTFYTDLFEKSKQGNVITLSDENKLDTSFLEELNKLKDLEDSVRESNIIEGFEKLIEEGILYKKDNESYWLPYGHYGEGVLVFLNLVYNMIKAKNKILLIEEPENHLHPGYLKIIVEQIFLLSKKYNVQIFMTSHSYDLIQETIDYANKSKRGKTVLISLMVLDKGMIKKIDYDISQATKNVYEFNNDLRGI
jgi:AAA15 family ATPase/GTPase